MWYAHAFLNCKQNAIFHQFKSRQNSNKIWVDITMDSNAHSEKHSTNDNSQQSNKMGVFSSRETVNGIL